MKHGSGRKPGSPAPDAPTGVAATPAIARARTLAPRAEGARTSRQTDLAMKPLVVPKASDVLAAHVRDLIVGGRLSAGDALPTERALVTESGLSRASVREALRVLEVEGLISTKPGRTGGSTVTLPGRASVARSVELFVRSHGITLAALLECRVAIEPPLARLAALKRSDDELREMTDIHERFERHRDDVPTYKLVNLEWHLTVARASGNEPLVALMEAIAQPILEAAGYQEVTTDAIRREAVEAHRRILHAIRDRDAKAAFRHMDQHVSAYSEIARKAALDT